MCSDFSEGLVDARPGDHELRNGHEDYDEQQKVHAVGQDAGWMTLRKTGT